MSYIQDSLSDGEEIVQIFKQHWTTYIEIWAWIFLTLGIGTPIAIYRWLVIRGREYGITNRRVIRKTGIIGRNTDEVNKGAVETVEVKQGVLQRIFGCGHIYVTGRGGSIMGYRNIDNPLEVKRTIESEINREG